MFFSNFLANLALGFGVAFQPINLFYCFIGVLLGTIVGVLPGLGNSGAMAILLPITYYFSDAGAIMLLAGIYYGAQYGGSTTSILLNIPGEPQSIITCLDGYAMHKKGRGGAALGISAFGSFFAGTGGVVLVNAFAPILADWALDFGPPEYFALAMLGLTLVSYLSGGSVYKLILMAALGMLAATVGLDPLQTTDRYVFGIVPLESGLELIIVAMGLFGLNEVFHMVSEPQGAEDIIKPPKKLIDMLPNRQEWRESVKPILRGSLIGFLIGVLPGGGGVLATIVSYAVEKKVSKHPERFGTGEIAGVASPESANNGSSAGAFIPLLTLGIPSNVCIAILLGALMLHGITPGPMFMKTRPDVFWGLIASMYVGNVMLLVLNLPLIGLFTKIALIPLHILAALIAFICLFGAFTVNNNPFDIYIMVFFGVFAFMARAFEFPVAPFIFGFILGPMVEISLRRSLIMSKGDFSIFVSKPMTVTFLAVALLLWITPIFRTLLRKRKQA